MNHIHCKLVKTKLSAFHDGELGKSESESVREHLLNCQNCRNAAAEYRNISKWLAPDSEAPAMSVNFTDRVMERIYQETGGEAPRVLYYRSAVRAVSMAAAIVLGVSLLYLAAPRSSGILDAASQRDVEARIQAMRELGNQPVHLLNSAGSRPTNKNQK
ncbi:MAG: anti-sigma factor family protein [Planctomycetota bacterium]